MFTSRVLCESKGFTMQSLQVLVKTENLNTFFLNIFFFSNSNQCLKCNKMSMKKNRERPLPFFFWQSWSWKANMPFKFPINSLDQTSGEDAAGVVMWKIVQGGVGGANLTEKKNSNWLTMVCAHQYTPIAILFSVPGKCSSQLQ